MAFHSTQQRIQRPRADVIAVPPELSNHPLTIHGTFRCMVQDVDFPEAQQNFSNELGILEIQLPIVVDAPLKCQYVGVQ